jgi:hypothetical protein
MKKATRDGKTRVQDRNAIPASEVPELYTLPPSPRPTDSPSQSIHCRRQKCGKLIPAAAVTGNIARCLQPNCNRGTCARCGGRKHKSNRCPEDEEELTPLAERNDWRECPHCGNLVERNGGCKIVHCVVVDGGVGSVWEGVSAIVRGTMGKGTGDMSIELIIFRGITIL